MEGFRMNYLFQKMRLFWLKSLSAKARSRTKTVLESATLSRGLNAVRVSPRKSVNNPAADFHGITVNFHIIIFCLMSAAHFWSDFHKLAMVRESLRQDYSRFVED